MDHATDQEPRHRPRTPDGVTRFLLRDRDGKYGQAFDAGFLADDLRIIKSTPQAPRMNAHCERVIGTLRRELLDHILITDESHARQVLKTYEDHYNRHRPTKPETNYHPKLSPSTPNRRSGMRRPPFHNPPSLRLTSDVP